MKVFRLMTLSLLLVSLFCFFAASASAGDANKQGSTQVTAVEDPGNSGAPHNDDGAVGNPSHDDDWARKDKPSNGNWGSGNHPGQGGPITALLVVILVAL